MYDWVALLWAAFGEASSKKLLANVNYRRAFPLFQTARTCFGQEWPKIGLRPGQHDHTVALAPADDGPRREPLTGCLVRVLRFARERRLVHGQRFREEFQVRLDDVAGSHANDVAGDQLTGWNDLPTGIAQDARTDL